VCQEELDHKIPEQITRRIHDEIRRIIYTTNAIESLNSTLKKTIKNRASFPNDEAAIKLLYLSLNNIRKKWTMPTRNGDKVSNQFAILYGEQDALMENEKSHLHKLSDTLPLLSSSVCSPFYFFSFNHFFRVFPFHLSRLLFKIIPKLIQFDK